MLQARAHQRDGEDDRGSRCDADDYTIHLKKIFQMQSMSEVRYGISSAWKMFNSFVLQHFLIYVIGQL
jgi:hypothetical protein